MRAPAFALVLLAATGARAEIGAVDVVPAATLLVPYFEVQLDGRGQNTIVTVTNTEAGATVAHVTLWTDMAVPAFSYDLYLTGYDQATLDLRLLFAGGLREVTASAGQDVGDELSPKGSLSQDINFASCNGLLPAPQQLPDATRQALAAAFSGRASALLAGKCGGANLGDGVARGYITIDVTNACTTKVPGDAGYFTTGGNGIAGNRNVLTGHVEQRHIFQNFTQQDPLVHLEASSTSPLTSGAGATTFYRGRTGTSADNREALPSLWQARFANRHGADGPASFIWSDTDFLVWRDPGVAVAPFTCAGATPAPFPLPLKQLTAYDESAHQTNVATTAFPRAAMRVRAGGSTLDLPTSGLLILDLAAPAAFRQGHVTLVHFAEGRYSIAHSAFPVGGNP